MARGHWSHAVREGGWRLARAPFAVTADRQHILNDQRFAGPVYSTDKDRDFCAWTHSGDSDISLQRLQIKAACVELLWSQRMLPGLGTTDSRD